MPPLAGLLLRRWWVALLPIVLRPLFEIGLNDGWWGCCGAGENWQFWTEVYTVVGLVTTLAAVALGRALASRA